MTTKKTKAKERGCPVKSTVECLQFPPIVRTPEAAGMTTEQIAAAGITPNQRLYWCSECTKVWYESEHHFAHVIGTGVTWGHPFVPNASRRDPIYIG
jgi:hypothetical protein